MAPGDEERKERLRASRELGRANRSIAAVRSFYIANAMLAGIVLGVMLLAEASAVAVAIAAAVFLVALAGIRGVRTEPYLWTLGAALVWTALVAFQVAIGAYGGLMFFLSCAWTLGCWVMLPTTLRVRELLKAHPDLRIARKMRERGTR